MNQLALAVSVAASLGAAAIHFALGPHHVDELGDLGLGFYLAGIVQVIIPGALLVARHRARRAFRSIVLAGMGSNATILAAWVVSRVVGLPAGPQPWTPEAIGVADSVSAALEVLVVAMGVVLIRRAPASAEQPRGRSVRLQSLALGPAIALIGVATSFALFSPDGVAGHGAAGHGADCHSHGLMEAPFVRPKATTKPADQECTTVDAEPRREIKARVPAVREAEDPPTQDHDDVTEPHDH